MSAMMSTDSPMQDFLKAAGLGTELASRIIIDMQVNAPVRVYIERYGSEKMFQVKPPDLSRAEIAVLGGEEKFDVLKGAPDG